MARVLVVASHFEKGGAEKQLSLLADSLQSMGHEVTHLVLSDEVVPTARNADVQCYALGFHRFRSPRLAMRFLKYVREAKPEAIVSSVEVCDLLAALARVVCGTKWIMREANSPRVRPYSRLRSVIGKRADVLISNNLAGYEYWQSKRSKPTVHVPNLLDPTLPQVQISGKRTKLTDSDYICCVGRLEEQKNFGLALRALGEGDLKIGCRIVGEGGDRQLLTSLAKELGIENRVDLVGYQENPASLIRNAKCLVAPSLFEGCPNVAMESLALGTPLVISDIPEHRAIFSENTAFFFSVSDPSACANAIRNAVENQWPNGFERYSEDRASLLKEWKQETNAERYSEQIETVLRDHAI